VKYWHAPYHHAKSMGIIAAYDIYNECCDGELEPSWKVAEKERMTFSVSPNAVSTNAGI